MCRRKTRYWNILVWNPSGCVLPHVSFPLPLVSGLISTLWKLTGYGGTGFSLPECATSDMTIDGYRIPAGTPCIIDWWRLNSLSEVWQRDGYSGTSFQPQRFRSLSPQDYRWSFLRFGLESRTCIGKNISGILMKTFLVGVLQKFDLQSVGPNGEDMSETRKDRFTVTPDKRVRLVSL